MSQEGRHLTVTNCLGIEEQDAFSKKFNFFEGIVVYALVIFIMWGIIWPFALNPNGPQIHKAENVGYVLLGILAIWAMIISPILHKDTFKGIGLGHPRQFIEFVRIMVKKRKFTHFFILIVGICILTWAALTYSSEILESITITEIIPAEFILTILVLAAFAFICFFMIRWDNFIQSFKMILIGWAIVGTFLITLAVIYCELGVQDWEKFQTFHLFGSDGFLINWFGYIFWGFMQHYLFLGYFNTRLRKGLPAKKILGIHGKYWSSILNTLYFGVIHFPAWNLAIFAFVGGFYFAYIFQKDKYRNLFAMGIIHGFGGALLPLLPWKLSVGPWNV
ncbi:MAG: hypothetical protein ACTSXF_02320 [Promethearchaeota archaeon]